MKKDVYSNFKIAHHKDKLSEILDGGLPYPTNVQWDLTNQCNVSCNFCYYKIHNELDDFSPTDTFPVYRAIEVLHELKDLGVKAIEWTGGGSIECHPCYKEILRESSELGFENGMVTNGTLLDNEAIDIMKDFAWVRFSLDANKPDTYNKIKKRDLLSTAKSNLEKLLEERDSKNVVGVSMIINRENYTEIEDLAQYAHDVGADNVRFSLAMTPQKEKLFYGIWEEAVEQMNKAAKLEDPRFKVFAFPNRINEISQKTLSPYCGYHHFTGVIGSNGGVYPCCLLKYRSGFNLGNLKEQTFEDIWKGDKRKAFKEKVDKGCNYSCWMTDKNKFIEYLLTDNPTHKNFV